MRKGQVHIYGIAEYRSTGKLVDHADSAWRIEDDEGRVFYSPDAQSSSLSLEVGDRVEFEPMFQSTAASRVTNRFWKIVRKLERES